MSTGLALAKRHAVIGCVMALIVSVYYFRLGRFLPNNLIFGFRSYFSDFAYPFGCYFLLCLFEHRMPVLQSWVAKWLIVFLLGAFDETLQYLGIPLLGATFDFRDFFFYAFGAGVAVLVDQQAFPRLFGFWALEKTASSSVRETG